MKSNMDFRVIDISESGLQVETKTGLPPASACELKMTAEGQEIRVKAKVRRCRAQINKNGEKCEMVYRSGLEFVNLDPGEADRVRRLITDLCDVGVLAESAAAVNAGEVISGALYSV